MNASNVSGHWTDEQLIQHLYGVGPHEGHLEGCRECQDRLSSMRSMRRDREQSTSSDAEVSFEFLAAQRRKIYNRITEPARWWSHLELRRWASVTATLFVLGGGLLFYKENHKQVNNISDAQLAQDVSHMAEDAEPSATAPLQALFEE